MKKLKLNYYMDFYGNLLTDNQKKIMKYYLFDDYSIIEISDITSKTKQNIFDTINRSSKKLIEYEEKLGLYNRFLLDRIKLRKYFKIIKDEGLSQEVLLNIEKLLY